MNERTAIACAFHRARCHWCAIGSPYCPGLSTDDKRRAAEFLASRELLAQAGVA
jgi:hypothetical protein